MKAQFRPYCFVTATFRTPDIARENETYRGLFGKSPKVLKAVVECADAKEAKQVEKRMKQLGNYIRISRAKNKPNYDKKRYATRFSRAERFLKYNKSK